ncbi:hypothetical protein BpHYR1_009068 [Brachionus plicatilis]|uniref:Uncharacterized protein n=1 Tax=Brachionus plicatilis TaxID=10195 RepID=A0A3M7QNC7_BRAPC|nr:hypothetical protein BpHYR1_009068 [Brachionus plicatilis]
MNKRKKIYAQFFSLVVLLSFYLRNLLIAKNDVKILPILLRNETSNVVNAKSAFIDRLIKRYNIRNLQIKRSCLKKADLMNYLSRAYEYQTLKNLFTCTQCQLFLGNCDKKKTNKTTLTFPPPFGNLNKQN